MPSAIHGLPPPRVVRWVLLVAAVHLSTLWPWTGTAKAVAAFSNPDYEFTRLAGQVQAAGHSDGPPNGSRFLAPVSLTVGNGLVYVADRGNDRVRLVNSSGIVSTVAGPTFLNQPSAIANDPVTGAVVFADTANHTIKQLAGGLVRTIAGSLTAGATDGVGTAARFWRPTGVAFDSTGAMFVSDTLNHTIRRISPEGAVTTIAGRAGHPGGADLVGVEATFDLPTGIAVDGTGRLYVAESGGRRIRTISPTLEVNTLATLGGSAGDGFDPLGIAVDANGMVYVADGQRHVIYRITTTGFLTTIGGLSGVAGYAGGRAGEARFDRPTGIAVDGSGTLYIADSGNQVIRRGVWLRPPAAPTDVVAVPGDAEVSVSFLAPADLGGAQVLSYVATSSPGGHVGVGGSSPLVVSGLTNGVEYTFTVTASNQAGTGPSSAPSLPVTPSSVPGMTTDVSAVAGNRQTAVSFSPPADTGGAPILEYLVTASPSGVTTVGTSSPVVVPGLTNGVSYTFTVRAVNRNGAGPPSAPSASVTPASVPGAPVRVVGTALSKEVRVDFDPPADTGGIPITFYTVTASPGGATATGSASPVVVTGLSNGTAYTFTATATNDVGTGPASAASAPVTPMAPSITGSPSTLRFAATKNGAGGDLLSVTGVQTVTVTFTGSPTPQWTATSNQTWALVTNGTGTGAGSFSVSVVNSGNVIGGSTTRSATVTLSAPNAGTTATIPVTLTVTQQAGTTTAPIGQVDTPIQASTGAQGAIAMTGWVVDDVGVQHVRIYRQCLPFDNQAACQTVLGATVVFVGEASVIPGARPDVEALYPTLPAANSAGWGFLILSNLLPNIPATLSSGGGVGTFTLYAVATDVEGNQKLLGRTVNDATPTTVTVANDTIAKPFGAIDTPGQGATVSGVLNNFGWALTPDPGTNVLIPTTGSTINVFIDGAPVGTATYNLCRGTVGNPVPAGVLCDDDVSSIFRNAGSFRNLDAARGAIGLRSIDTTTLTNGLHTISWGVTDSANRSEGIGSRYFNVLNSSADSAIDVGRAGFEARQDRGVQDHAALLYARTGYDLQAAYTPLETNADGVPQVRIPEHGRIELQLPGVVDGALIVNGEARPLPVGVGLDRERGIITWVAGPGYLGTYRLRFEVPESRSPEVRGAATPRSFLVDVTVHPQAAADQPIRMHIDRVDQDGQVFTMHGWSVDPHAATGSGIGAVHIWARRRDGAVQGSGFRVQGASAHSEAPVFLGTATLGLARPDVAAAHGAQFPNAGFAFTGELPEAGEWDVTAYVWVTRTGRFEDARSSIVRIQ